MSDTTETTNEGQNTSNVLPINDKKRRKKNSPPPEIPSDEDDTPKPPKLTMGQVETDLIAILERKPVTDFTPFPLNQVPQLPVEFRVFRSRRIDDVCLVEVCDNTAYLTSKENVASDLAEFCGSLAGVCGAYNGGLARCERAVKSWAYRRRALAKIPPSWGFRSDPGICFNRLPYDPIETPDSQMDTAAPTFAEMSSRLRNKDAFHQRLGSIFYHDASRKQALWVWGPSGGGKSQIAVLLKALMGDAYVGFDNEDFDDAFWKADLIDKRVAYIKEADPTFLHSSMFKSLTGDAGQRMNKKYLQAFEAQINTMTFLASNNPPQIPNDDAIKARIIPCYMEPVPESLKVPESELAARFERELPYIAGYCMRIYREQCPTRGAIKFDFAKHLQPAIDNYESEFLDIVEEHFRMGSPNMWISSKEFKTILIDCGMKDEAARRKFKDFLKGRYPQLREDRENRVTANSTSTARGWAGITKKLANRYS